MNITKRPIARFLVGGLLAAGTAAALVPGVASADRTLCVGKTIEATANNQWLVGTECADTFKMGQFHNVKVDGRGGNDVINVGFGPGPAYVYAGAGNDTIVNPHDRQVWVYAGPGNDTIEGSSGQDWIYGEAGTDTAEINTGDVYSGIEVYI